MSGAAVLVSALAVSMLTHATRRAKYERAKRALRAAKQIRTWEESR